MPSDVQIRAQLRTQHGETILELPDGRLAVVLSDGWQARNPGECRVCRRLTVFQTSDHAQAHPGCLRGLTTWAEYETELELERLDAIPEPALPPPLLNGQEP